MHTFASVVERYMKVNRPLYLFLSGLPAFLIELIEGQEVTSLNYDIARRATNWEDQDDLAVVCISSNAQYEMPILSALRDRLIGELRYSCTFPYVTQIVCVVSITKSSDYDTLVHRLDELIPHDAFHWGIGYKSAGMRQVAEHYQQSPQLLERTASAGQTSLIMYEATPSIIEERLKNLPELQNLVRPGVRRLQQINRQGNSQYVRTLLEYLICGGNYTDTAQCLGLHRNSLVYRMTRIQGVTHCNLEDFQTQKVLLFSLLIAGNTSN